MCSSDLGDVLAVVVAESRLQARHAASLVAIDYQPLAPITDSVAAGGLVERGNSWFYRDPSARQTGGFFRVKITPRTDPTGYRIDVQGFGDMSSATDPVMTVTATMCGVSSATTDTWTETPSGWLVNLDPVGQCGGSASGAFIEP